jgi:transcription antitermination factor NusG
MEASREKKWYAVYTRPRNEKKVYAALIEASIETFLPLIKSLKQWSDRRKWVEEPLFRSYLFVHISQSQYYGVLSIPGLVRYITFQGKAVTVPPGQILAIKQYIDSEEIITERVQSYIIGDRVEIYRGHLKGLSGNLVRIKGNQKVKIEIESIGHSIILTIPQTYIKKVKTAL